MRIVICGAGQVGHSIAQQLAREDNEVTLIDQDPDLIQTINDSLDVRAFCGHASHPNVLEMAGAAEADMLVAVTYSDEVNMVACQIGYSLFNIPMRIARVRHQSYLNPMWQDLYSNDHLAIDVIISPEIEVANAIIRRLHEPGALDMIPFMNSSLKVVAVRCMEDCMALNLPLSLLLQKAHPLSMNILGFIRDGVFHIPSTNTMLHAGDDVYFAAPPQDVRKTMELFGHREREARRIVLLGGGNIGLYIAEQLEQDSKHDTRVKIIEYSQKRAEQIASQLHNTTVIHGSALQRDILTEANIDMVETVLAVTNDDETNIIGSLLAKRYGCERTVTLVNNGSYAPLLSNLGIDVVVNPRETTVSSILQHVRRGKISAVHSISNGMAELIEAEAIETSSMVGKSIEELHLPKGIIIGTIMRGKDIIIPQPDTIILERDKILILATADMVKKVEKIFSVSLEYF